MYLRWVGGKGSISNELVSLFPDPSSIDVYIEPFVGSAAMFLSYVENFSEGCLFGTSPSVFNLSDTNKFLINCHSEVRDNIDKLCDEVRILETKHNSLSYLDKKKLYLEIRDSVTDWSCLISAPTLMAAKFLYVNKVCFNGLWRVNKSGKYNVPYNQSNNINFNYTSLKIVSQQLASANIYVREFDQVDNDELGSRTFVYMDPPYIPLSSTSSFTSYTVDGFKKKEIARLVVFCEKLDAAGAKWMMSNSSSPLVYDTFKKWNISEIDVHRFVKAIKKKDEKRKKVPETIIKNY